MTGQMLRVDSLLVVGNSEKCGLIGIVDLLNSLTTEIMSFPFSLPRDKMISSMHLTSYLFLFKCSGKCRKISLKFINLPSSLRGLKYS